jgi:hypothetical protein
MSVRNQKSRGPGRPREKNKLVPVCVKIPQSLYDRLLQVGDGYAGRGARIWLTERDASERK